MDTLLVIKMGFIGFFLTAHCTEHGTTTKEWNHLCGKVTQCAKTRNVLSLKKLSWNQFAVRFICERVDFTEFFWKNTMTKFHKLPHCEKGLTKKSASNK